MPVVFNSLPPMSLWWLRPLLAFTWMDMLGINVDDGSYGIGHSTSKMTLFKRLQRMSIILRQELGETRKASWSFQTHFMSNLVDHKVNIVDDFLWENFQEHTHVDQLWASFCDKSRGKPGEQVKALRHIACPPLSMKISPLLLFWWRAHNQSCRFVFDENREIDLTD